MDKKMISMCESNKSAKECLKIQQSEDVMVRLPMESNNKIEDVFPWLSKFNNLVHSSAGSRNYQHLEQLLYLYTPNISSNLEMSNIKFNDAVKLKNHINNMLIFFYLYWRDIKQDIVNHRSYLNKMSTLLNVYIDMELKFSTRDKDSSEIAAKILAALYIYLNDSEEHIFRVLLRIKHINRKICNYILTKSFTYLKTKTSITDITYVRYLLAFKMWKKMENISDKREEINRLAKMMLGPRMPNLRDELLSYMPKPPTNQENETLWLLQSNVDLEQVHKHFLLFEDKINNSDLQCPKVIHADLSCLRLQKPQMISLFHQSNSNDINHQINKDYSSSMKNCNIISSNNNGKKYLTETYLRRNETKCLKSRNQEIKIIDLTGDNEVINTCKVRKKTKKPLEINTCKIRKKTRKEKKKVKGRNLEYLKNMESTIRNKKHINFPTRTSRADIEKYSKNESKKVPMDCISISENKINDSTESCILTNTRDSLNDMCNFQKNNYLNTKNQFNVICPKPVKDDENQCGYNSHYIKLPVFDQNTEDLKVAANILKENEAKNYASHLTYMTGNAVNSYNNPMLQSKETLTPREENTTETTMFKMCQNNIADQHLFRDVPFKQKLSTSTDCSVMQKSCWETMLIKNLKSINDHSSQLTEMIEQKVCQVNECPNCCVKIDRKPFLFTNTNVTESKVQETLHNTFNENKNDVKLACNTNIIYINSGNKYVYVVNHIDEQVMAVHAEKRIDKSNDACTVSTTFTGDQVVESSLCNHHVNFDNVTINNYGNIAKYSEMKKKEQKESDCDSSTLNDKLHPETYTFDINSSEISSNVEVDNEQKNFPKTEKTEKITKTDCIDDLVRVSVLNNIQSETLENFSHQSSAISQINFDNLISTSTKKPCTYTDCDITEVKTQDTLHNMFNKHGIESSNYNANMQSDGNKYLYVMNHTGEHVITTNAEQRRQCLSNSTICDVSTTVIGDHIMGSLDDHVISDNRRKHNFEYLEATMKEQHKSDCDTSISNNQLHSSELYTYDSDSFDIDSKEANEIMNADCIEDFENISFSHDNPIVANLEHILSNTRFSPPLDQSSFELDSLYTDTVVDDKDILYNTQNDVIDSSVDPIVFCSNNDTFLRLSVKSDKLILQETVEES